ncbi:MAG TPA: hypothetical protein VER33_07850 [Polyangiaceae bacterium]|nr:hypothetical protein [Polyangiaceae bacterium]
MSTPLQLRLNSAEARLVLAMRILGQQASRAEAAERWVREQGPAVLSLLAGEPQHAEDAHALQSAVQELRAIVRRAGT